VIRLLGLAALFAAAAFSAAVPATAAPSAPAAAASPVATPSATPVPDICSTGISAVISRPTQTTSACVVKPNQALIESGYQSQTVVTAGGSYTFQTVPNAAIRIGTALQNVEFQVLPPSSIRSNGATASSDAGAGLKWQIASTPAFAYGVNVIATAPTGTDPAVNPNGLGSSNAGTYVANANIQGSLGKIFGYGATFSVQSLAAPGATSVQRYTSIVPSADVTVSLPASWGLAFEAFRQTNGEGPATPAHTWFDVALSKGIGKAQFDASYGTSNAIVPAPGAPSIRRHYAGFGVSYGF
jgi:hypothetical protein